MVKESSPKALTGPTFQELGELSSKTSLRQELPPDFGRNVSVALSCRGDEVWEMLLHPFTRRRMRESPGSGMSAALRWQQSALPALLGNRSCQDYSGIPAWRGTGCPNTKLQ